MLLNFLHHHRRTVGSPPWHRRLRLVALRPFLWSTIRFTQGRTRRAPLRHSRRLLARSRSNVCRRRRQRGRRRLTRRCTGLRPPPPLGLSTHSTMMILNRCQQPLRETRRLPRRPALGRHFIASSVPPLTGGMTLTLGCRRAHRVRREGSMEADLMPAACGPQSAYRSIFNEKIAATFLAAPGLVELAPRCCLHGQLRSPSAHDPWMALLLAAHRRCTPSRG